MIYGKSESDNNENRKDFDNNMDKKINDNKNKLIKLYDETDKHNLSNKDNTNFYNKNKKFNYNKNYISNIKNMKLSGNKILSKKNESKNNSKYKLLNIPSNDYLLNLLQNYIYQ